MSMQQAMRRGPTLQPARDRGIRFERAHGSQQPGAPRLASIPVQERWLELQRGIGNQAVSRLLQRQARAGPFLQRKCACGGGSSNPDGECEECREQTPFLQAKLTIGAPHDVYEQEADRVAEQVTRAPDAGRSLTSAPPQISHKCVACEAEAEEEGRQRKPAGARTVVREAPALVQQVLGSPGRALDAVSRAYFEPRFGRDFNRVRIHDDAHATQSARAVNALAYTSGQHIVFGAGAYSPGSDAGRKLLAHELTHTIQQSSRSAPAAGIVQRQPQWWTTPPSERSTPFFAPSMSNDTELYFGKITDVCPSCHQASEQSHFQVHNVQHAKVTESNIREWAATEAWGEAVISGKSLNKARLFRLLLRHEDKKLDAIWESYRQPTVAKVLPNWQEDLRRPVFSGSDAARRYWAKYVDSVWTTVVADLSRRALDWLVREIDAILHTRVIPAGATLVTDPARIAAIEDKPATEKIDLTRWGATATVGFEWVGKRIKSAESGQLDFEVIGHEGIYFELSVSDFQKTDPLVGKVAGDVTAATKGITIVGRFIKGLLNALASPVTMALDTAAKVIDMASLGISALGKWRGWYDIGYTCLSSTCRQYENCVQSGEDWDECKSDLMKTALEEATIIIPIYKQGRECLAGDAEACGGIAVLALGLVKEGGGRSLSTAEFEQAAVRSAIERPRAGDPNFAKTLEKPAPHERAGQSAAKAVEEPAGKAPAREEAAAGRKAEPVAKSAPREAAIERFAEAKGISAKQLKADLTELRKNAKNPDKVSRPADPHFDAEIETNAGEHHRFDREKRGPSHEGEPGTWCRFSPGSGKCGVPIDPEIDKMVDEALKESDGKKRAKQPAAPPEKTLTEAEYEKIKAEAEAAFNYGDKPGQISAEVGRHKDAPAIRAGEGVSGRDVQSAHDAPSSFMKTLDDYSRDNAITMQLEKGKHRSFDQTWKDWAQEQRRLGRDEVTVGELHDVMADAIEGAPITDGQKSALYTVLLDELYEKHGLSRASKIELPYRTTPALKPGPELTALKAKNAAEQKARAQIQPKSAAREKALLQKKIETYERVAKFLESKGDQRAQVWRLELAKLKKRQKK
jgi:hypothetical protein